MSTADRGSTRFKEGVVGRVFWSLAGLEPRPTFASLQNSQFPGEQSTENFDFTLVIAIIKATVYLQLFTLG